MILNLEGKRQPEFYPETWTEYLTVRELREALSDPRLMEGDLTNVVTVKRGGDIRFQLKVENDADRELEERGVDAEERA